MANARAKFTELQKAAKPGERACEWPGCLGEGEHRAPRSRDDLNTYRWFCLDHVRAYNKSWNYYAGMTEDEVEHDTRRDTVWHRPSWPMGGVGGHGFAGSAADISDGFGVFGDQPGGHHQSSPAAAQAPEKWALDTLDLRPPLSVERVKIRYKELVKRYHPDANGGDKAAEEKFKEISRAYHTIMDNLTA